MSAANDAQPNVGREAADMPQGDAGSASEPKAKRDHRFETRVTKDELDRFDALSKQVGVSRADVVRAWLPEAEAAFDRRMRGAARRANVDRAQLDRVQRSLDEYTDAVNALERQMRAIGYHLSHLLRHARSGGSVPEEAVLAVLDEFEAARAQTTRDGLREYRTVESVSWAR